MKKYITRIIEKTISKKLSIFGAVHIVGPKWCGKTTTSLKLSKSFIDFGAFLDKNTLNMMFLADPSFVMDGQKPRLIDEWQDVPTVWDAVRRACDLSNKNGNYILTGSTSKKVKTSHTGTGRISKIKMYPMSLYESGDSNGEISLNDLFNNKFKTAKSNLSLKDLIAITCRGGWPKSVLSKNKESQLQIVKDYFNQIHESDIFSIDNVKRDSSKMKILLRSYARNISTLAKNSSLLEDTGLSKPTLDDYIDVLRRLYIIQEIEPWNLNIRSASAIRNGLKREFVDPSLAIAALNANPTKLFNDLNTFGMLFECLCIRDLRVYSTNLGGQILYYRDRYGLECDCVLELDDGRYALIEIKLFSPNYIKDACENLNKIEKLIKEFNKSHTNKIELPTFKMVLTNFKYSYKTEEGIYIVPIGCLKD